MCPALLCDVAALYLYAAPYRIEIILGQSTLHLYKIGFRHFIGRMGKMLGKFAVSSKNQQTFAVIVESAYGINPADAAAQNIHNGLAPFIVGNRA